MALFHSWGIPQHIFLWERHKNMILDVLGKLTKGGLQGQMPVACNESDSIFGTLW